MALVVARAEAKVAAVKVAAKVLEEEVDRAEARAEDKVTDKVIDRAEAKVADRGEIRAGPLVRVDTVSVQNAVQRWYIVEA
jgi:hypothetical protein